MTIFKDWVGSILLGIFLLDSVSGLSRDECQIKWEQCVEDQGGGGERLCDNLIDTKYGCAKTSHSDRNQGKSNTDGNGNYGKNSADGNGNYGKSDSDGVQHVKMQSKGNNKDDRERIFKELRGSGVDPGVLGGLARGGNSRFGGRFREENDNRGRYGSDSTPVNKGSNRYDNENTDAREVKPRDQEGRLDRPDPVGSKNGNYRDRPDRNEDPVDPPPRGNNERRYNDRNESDRGKSQDFNRGYRDEDKMDRGEPPVGEKKRGSGQSQDANRGYDQDRVDRGETGDSTDIDGRKAKYRDGDSDPTAVRNKGPDGTNYAKSSENDRSDPVDLRSKGSPSVKFPKNQESHPVDPVSTKTNHIDRPRENVPRDPADDSERPRDNLRDVPKETDEALPKSKSNRSDAINRDDTIDPAERPVNFKTKQDPDRIYTKAKANNPDELEINSNSNRREDQSEVVPLQSQPRRSKLSPDPDNDEPVKKFESKKRVDDNDDSLSKVPPRVDDPPALEEERVIARKDPLGGRKRGRVPALEEIEGGPKHPLGPGGARRDYPENNRKTNYEENSEQTDGALRDTVPKYSKSNAKAPDEDDRPIEGNRKYAEPKSKYSEDEEIDKKSKTKGDQDDLSRNANHPKSKSSLFRNKYSSGETDGKKGSLFSSERELVKKQSEKEMFESPPTTKSKDLEASAARAKIMQMQSDKTNSFKSLFGSLL